MIDRTKILKRYSPHLTRIDYHSPLTVGNSSIAMTVDPTGIQSLNREYLEKGVPLCTLSNWGWKSRAQVKLHDLKFTRYQTGITHETVAYPTDVPDGQKELYQQLRANPHRVNLIYMGWSLDNRSLQSSQLSQIQQTLDLSRGAIDSRYHLNGQSVAVKTLIGKEDTIGVSVSSKLSLELELAFPNSSPQMDGSDWQDSDEYQTKIIKKAPANIDVECDLTTLHYHVAIKLQGFQLAKIERHRLLLKKVDQEAAVVVAFNNACAKDFDEIQTESAARWHEYWSTVGFYDLKNEELERRVVLSEYLLKAQDAGKLPPQETGLTVNSWNGKFHLEMTFWHEAWLTLHAREQDLLPIIKWYQQILPQAEANARDNGYRGARWPKQVGPDAISSPSNIAPLLLWQQPHVIVMLEMLYQKNPTDTFLQKNWQLVEESADFMTDFLVEQGDSLHLQSPLVPSQERFGPNNVEDPTFELEYWRFGLQLAAKWADRLHKKVDWKVIADKIAKVDESFDTYVPVRDCEDTFVKHNTDHPTFVGIYGLIPTRMHSEKVKKSLMDVLQHWDNSSLWGWDYPMLAMVASKLGDFNLAIKILLDDDPKNTYLINGNNYQTKDLPLYLPGNGGLMLAMARLATDFPDKITCENVTKWPW